MSINSVIDKCLKMLAARIHKNDQKVGDLAQLTTSEKSSMVAAINALSDDLNGRENISESRVEEIVKAELAKAKVETLETELNAVKAYVGYEQRETLETKITHILNNGTES